VPTIPFSPDVVFLRRVEMMRSPWVPFPEGGDIGSGIAQQDASLVVGILNRFGRQLRKTAFCVPTVFAQAFQRASYLLKGGRCPFLLAVHFRLPAYQPSRAQVFKELDETEESICLLNKSG
jgi:hypothetical protein